MKKAIIFALLCLPLNALAQSPIDSLISVEGIDGLTNRLSIKLDEKNGFKGIKFGTPKSAFKDLRLIKVHADGTAVYWRTSERKELAGEPLNHLSWVFYKDRFYAVLAQTSIKADHDKVKELLIAAYGEPGSENDDNLLYWFGQKAVAIFRFEEDEFVWTLFVRSTPISEQKEKDAAARLKRAAEKL